MKLSTVVIVLLMVAIMWIGGEFTDAGMDWYQGLTLPPLTPPGIYFAYAWLVIYTLIAICLIRVWKERPKPFGWIMTLFGINLSLNFIWSYIFFTKQMMLLGFVDICLLWVSICALICYLRKSSRLNAFLLVPYGLWVAFAGYLNFTIWWLNA